MRNLKRVLSLALALVMVLGMMVITTSAADYTDAEEITYTEAVEVMSAIGILAGNPDGTFAPQGTLTREQAAKILAFVCLGADADDYLTGSAAPFEDVAADKWSAKYIAFCKNAKIINGVNAEQTLFNPNGILTDVQFAKMLLVALEIEGTYTGSGWEANVKAALKDNDLDVIKVTGAEISREDACELALAAMKYSATPDAYNVIDTKGTSATTDDTVVAEFDKMLDAVLYASVLNNGGTRYTYAQAPATDTLLSEIYKTSYIPVTTDAFGRPARAYTDSKNFYLEYVDEAVAKFVTGFNANSTKAYDFTGAEIVVNGNTNTDVPTTLNDLLTRGYVGTTIELYNTDTDKAIDKIVLVQGYLTKVTDVKSDDKVDATQNYIKLAVYNPWADGDVVNVTLNDSADPKVVSDYDCLTADYAKNDYLFTYWTEGNPVLGLVAYEDVTSVKATVTAKKLDSAFSGTIIADGKTYTMASGYAEAANIGGDVTLGTEYTLYFDANGYVVGAAPKQAPKAQVAVMTQIVKVTNNTNGSIGAAGSEYMEAELVFFDGTVEVVKVASFTGTGTPATTYEVSDWIDAIPTYFNNTVVKYTVNAKGEYVLIGQTAGVTASDVTLADSVEFATGNLANNSTKFIIRTGAGTKQDPYKYAAYTGYANLPVKTLNANSADVTGLKYSAPGDTNVAEFVYITATVKTTTNDNKTQAFVTGAPTEVYVDAFTTYYEYPVIIAGEATVLNVADTGIVEAGKLYTIKTLDADGYVTDADEITSTVTIATAAKDGIIQLSTGWKTYSESTVVYVIDTNAGTATTADITALDATSDGIDVGYVYVTYVQLPNNGGDSAAIAQIIALKA